MSNESAFAPILLVEDNPADLELTLLAFRRRRFANPVLVARDGEEALAFLPRWETGEPLPLVVLLDLKLPKVDGHEVLRTFRAHPAARRVPVVVLTSSSEEGDVALAYDLGATSYLVKPVDFEQFTRLTALIEAYWCGANVPAPRPAVP
ncbi:MAG: response regulator [Holophagales bacterium]|nr:response regulator [Holophagales bacterium]